MQVVNLVHAGVRGHRHADLLGVESLGCGFEQHVDCLLQDRPRAGGDQQRDQDRHDRIDRLPAGEDDHEGGDDHADRAGQVAEHVAERCAYVEAFAARTDQDPGGEQMLTTSPSDRDHQHAEAEDLDRVLEPPDRLDDHPDRDDHEQHAVDQCGEDLGPLEAEGSLRRRRSGGERDRAARARNREKLSESMCPASASRARLPVSSPPTASATMKPAVRSAATIRARRSAPR